jgi:hypothetical protein
MLEPRGRGLILQPSPFVFVGTETVALTPEDHVTANLAFTSTDPEGLRRKQKETDHTRRINNR